MILKRSCSCGGVALLDLVMSGGGGCAIADDW